MMGAQGMEMMELEYKDRLAAVTAERDKLKKFKEYVHTRLDAAGVPVDPESSHKAEGCRIGGRLDIVLDGKVKQERDELRELIRRVKRMISNGLEVGYIAPLTPGSTEHKTYADVLWAVNRMDLGALPGEQGVKGGAG